MKKKIDIPWGPVIVGGVAYFGIVHPVLVKMGIFKTAAERKQDALKAQALQNTMDDVLSKQSPTYSDAELSNFTEVIYQSMRYSSLDDDYERAGYYLSLPRNTADVYKIINFFGEREECYVGVFCYKKTLVQMVSSNLSDSKIAAINDNYKRKGIKFQW